MVVYKCPRCFYSCEHKTAIKRHYNRKKLCEVVGEDISITMCLINLNKKKIKIKNKLDYCETVEQLQQELNEKSEELIENNQINEIIQQKIKQQEQTIQTLQQENKKLKLVIKNNRGNTNTTDDEYIYLIQEREFVKSGENVYKIGRTNNFRNRMGDYPKGSKVIYVNTTDNSIEAEKELLVIFNDNFINREDIGKEYFQGCKNLMKELIKRDT